MPKSYNDPRLRRIYFSLPNFMREGAAAIYSMTQHRRRFGGVFKSHLAELQSNAGRTAQEHATDQLHKLHSTLSYAGAHCPYYSELFQKLNFTPDAIRTLSNLQYLPLLDKETVRNQGNRLAAFPPPRRIIKQTTSGTTGSPLMFIITEEANQRHYASQWFHMSWAGVQWGDRWVLFGGQSIAQPDSLQPPFWVLDRYEKELLFSSQHMTPNTLPDYARALADYRPAVICGYPSAIHVLALYLIEVGRTDIRPKGVFTWAETTLPYQRHAIEKAFGCYVYSSYGNGEHTGHLLQCERGNFHVVPETCVIEVLDTHGVPVQPGESGELVCTSLIERAMPLIRYRVGDTAIQGGDICSCGRTTPILYDVTGRTNDFVIGHGGRRLGPLNQIFKSPTHVREVQFFQEDVGSICLRVVPSPGFCDVDEISLLHQVHDKLGDQINVKVQVVDRIPRTANGKYPFVVSHLENGIPKSSETSLESLQ